METMDPNSSGEQRSSEGSGWFVGAAGRAWSYVTNEAAALDATGPPPPLPKPNLILDVQVELQGRDLGPYTDK